MVWKVQKNVVLIRAPPAFTNTLDFKYEIYASFFLRSLQGIEFAEYHKTL